MSNLYKEWARCAEREVQRATGSEDKPTSRHRKATLVSRPLLAAKRRPMWDPPAQGPAVKAMWQKVELCHTAWQAGDAGAMLQRKQQLEEATSNMADKTIEVQEAVARSRALCIDALAWLQDEHDELSQEDFFDYGKAEEKSLIDDAWAATLA